MIALGSAEARFELLVAAGRVAVVEALLEYDMPPNSNETAGRPMGRELATLAWEATNASTSNWLSTEPRRTRGSGGGMLVGTGGGAADDLIGAGMS